MLTRGGLMVETSGWVELTKANPDHSAWYVERFRKMAAAGDDLAGEARLIDAMAPRAGRILDAGCGPGRVGAILAGLGHEIVGVDADPVLIAAALDDHPGPTWLVGDLAELDLASHGIAEGFDLIVCAGNVMTFLAPGTRRQVLRDYEPIFVKAAASSPASVQGVGTSSTSSSPTCTLRAWPWNSASERGICARSRTSPNSSSRSSAAAEYTVRPRPPKREAST